MYISNKEELKKRMPKQLFKLLASFAVMTLPKEDQTEHEKFWLRVKDAIHPRADLRDTTRIIMHKWFKRLPYETPQSRLGNILNVLRETLAGERLATREECGLVKNISGAISKEYEQTQKQMLHAFRARELQTAVDALSEIASDYGAKVTLEQPKLPSDPEKLWKNQDLLMVKHANLNLQFHWSGLVLCYMGYLCSQETNISPSFEVIKSIFAIEST